jgi:hypothetical protein
MGTCVSLGMVASQVKPVPLLRNVTGYGFEFEFFVAWDHSQRVWLDRRCGLQGLPAPPSGSVPSSGCSVVSNNASAACACPLVQLWSYKLLLGYRKRRHAAAQHKVA